MTGEKNKFQTHEKLWNLDDKQLKSPKHDAMVVWLMDKDNLLSVLPYKKDITISTERNGDLFFEFMGVNIHAEVPIYSNTNFIGGYVDLLVNLVYEADEESKKRIRYTEPSAVIPQVIEVKPYIDSFGAVLRQMKSYKSMRDAKPYNSSLFLNKSLRPNYNDFKGYSHYYIFTFDERFDSQFESQFIGMLHPPKEISIEDMTNFYGGE